MNTLISTINCVFISLVGPSETGKSQFTYNTLKNGTFLPKCDKIHFFHQHSQTFHDVLPRNIEKFEFVQDVSCKFSDSLKNKGLKNLVIFNDSCEEFCKFIGIC